MYPPSPCLEDTKLTEHSARITSRTRTLGWAYSTTHQNGVFLSPPEPIYVGTIAQICKQIKGAKNLRPIERWFYRDAMITGIDDGAYASTDQQDIDTIIRCLDRKGAIVYLDREPTPRKEGRPKFLEGGQTVTLRLDRPSLEILDSLGDNRSATIRRLLRSQP